MDTFQSYPSSLSDSPVLIQTDRKESELDRRASGNFSHQSSITLRESIIRNGDGIIGVVEVFIHQARDIHNICIYQKQDVYAKLCLTDNPEITVSTKIVNGGGRNPIFNENLQLSVGQINVSLKCEIWMLSRVRNYMEDQLLGFALVPLSQVIGNGCVTQEFSLSSTDLFHSPAGFVQLSISYSGYSPRVSAPNICAATSLSVNPDTTLPDSVPDSSISTEYGKIEFPDLNMVNENERMVSEYFGIPCNNLDSESSESLIASGCENDLDPKSGAEVGESFSTGNPDSVEKLKSHSSPDSDLSNGSHSGPITAVYEPVCDSSGATGSPNLNPSRATGSPNLNVSGATGSPNLNNASPENGEPKSVNSTVGEKPETDSSNGLSNSSLAQSVLNINTEPEQQVMQQQIVDMYMKSMQQFTESLAKMKLPMDIENESADSDTANSGLDKKLQASKSTGSRVFYGSRAFF